MAEPNTIPAEGTILEYTLDAGTTYKELAGVISLTPPSKTTARVERPRLRTIWKRRRPSRQLDAGDLTATIDLDPNEINQHELYTQMDLGTMIGWRITYNDGLPTPARDTFDGFIESWEPSELAEESNVNSDLTIAIDGAIVRTQGAAT